MLPLHKYTTQSLVFALVSLGLLITPHQAKAVTITPLTSQDATPGFDDTDFNLLLDNGDFKELFVAEGRIGNNAGNGTQELSINRDVRAAEKPGQPIIQDQLTWGNGKLWDFKLQYDGSKVTYEIFESGNSAAAKILSTTEFTGPATDIFLRTRARDNTTSTTSNSITLSDLVFNGTSIGNLSSVGSATKDIDYLHLSNITTNFTLTGKTSFSWTGATPTNSNLAFQIKVGTSPQSASVPESVPEPGMLGGICLVATMGIAVSKRKKVAV
ncbi:PEP-CTERM sorting domain-containing protein [Sphaerospermopsis aphanizomenoides BCCUSP55]|uniref:choice-of-anchor W domain-containing protein n=1 Tax=Sphaerospermopsis aphanizomenoides TaxID=459663 RepID=UPI000AB19656|nr:choice-of-anchor W domain-containing protein [Sphaerospermopsis aphanizomenoides]MBK1990103.1 PEP-CTERM sorting domain-containing protein [Sphaerospermopsis aphanizomenoides BCCUSP55]